MGIRETLNENPRLTTGITAGIIVVVFALIFWSSGGSASPESGGMGSKVYFTEDDGKNYFAVDAKNIPPFQHDGKEAVRAYVYECNGKRFVNHLERYTPEGKQASLRLREAVKHGPPPGALVAAAQQRGREIKRPGETNWIPSNSPAAEAIITPKAPPGASGEATVVFP